MSEHAGRQGAGAVEDKTQSQGNGDDAETLQEG
jgi:hypothetical protein